MIRRQQVSSEALGDQKQFYDARFQQGYMEDFSDLYEACRVYTIRRIFNKMKTEQFNPSYILDYGCGEGRYIGVLREFFPESQIYGSDISDEGLQIARKSYPYAKYISMSDENVSCANNSFDLIISIEVLEHVKNVKKSAEEIGRLLKPDGIIAITTPCANKYSLEWFFNKFTGGLQPSFDGYGCFWMDEPAHLRRLNDGQVKSLFSEYGVDIYEIYHRSHFFTTLIEWVRPLKMFPVGLRARVALLDWHLFKRFPNGASMLALGRKK